MSAPNVVTIRFKDEPLMPLRWTAFGCDYDAMMVRDIASDAVIAVVLKTAEGYAWWPLDPNRAPIRGRTFGDVADAAAHAATAAERAEHADAAHFG